jgi:hypothetical protein
VNQTEDSRPFIRLTTDDVGLLLPALVEGGASFRISGRQHVDVQGMNAADVARVAALYNARVADLQVLQ